MKKFTLIVLSFITCLTVSAQKDGDFTRKGRVLVETGFSSFVGNSLSGSGGAVLIDSDGNSSTVLVLDGGYFLAEDFALKFNFGLVNVSGGFTGGTLTNFGVGGKYYIAGVAPIEAGAGLLTGLGQTEFIADFSIGYGITLANNINLEPSIGLIYVDDALFKLGINFAMFL